MNQWHPGALELVWRRREGDPSSGQTLQDCAELAELLGGPEALRSVIGGERPSPKTISQETSPVSGGSDISSRGWKERERESEKKSL